MRKLIIIFFVLSSLYSCKKESYNEMRILISNSLDTTIQVHLYPKPAYVRGDVYDVSSIGGGYAPMTFSISKNMHEYLYYTDNINISPQNLTSQIFDSIIINVNIDSAIVIKFTPDHSIHYSTNMFAPNSTWILKNDKRVESSRTTYIHDYSFEIKEIEVIKN